MTTILLGIIVVVSIFFLLKDFKKGLLILMPILPWAEYFPKTGIPGLNGITVVVGIMLIKGSIRPGFGESLDRAISMFVIYVIFSWVNGAVLSGVEGYHAFPTFLMMKDWVIAFLFYFAFRNLDMDEEFFRKLIFLMCLGVAIQGVWMIREFMIKGPHRLSAVLGQNDAGSFFVTYLALPLVLLNFSKSAYTRFFSVFTVVISFFSLAWAQSRGAYLAFGIILFIGCLLYKPKMTPIVLAATLVFVFYYRSILPSVMIKRIDMTFVGEEKLGFDTELYEGSAAARILLLEKGWTLFKESPVLGSGFRAFNYKIRKYLPRNVGYDSAHNMYLQNLVDLGLVGVLLFINMFFQIIRTTFRLWKTNPVGYYKDFLMVVLLATVSMIVVNMFGNRFYALSAIGYFMVIVGILANGKLRERLQERVDSGEAVNEA